MGEERERELSTVIEALFVEVTVILESASAIATRRWPEGQSAGQAEALEASGLEVMILARAAALLDRRRLASKEGRNSRVSTAPPAP